MKKALLTILTFIALLFALFWLMPDAFSEHPLHSEEMNEIIQTFRRYSYTIIFGNNDDQFLEDLKERSAYLDKYLNV